jgi:hypothetical protein
LERKVPGTVDDLVTRYYSSATFQKAGLTRQGVVRGIIESFRSEFGNDKVAGFASTTSKRSCWRSR